MAYRAVVAVLGLVIRAVPLVGLAVARAFAGDAQVDEHLWKISPEACPPTKPAATGVGHDQSYARFHLEYSEYQVWSGILIWQIARSDRHFRRPKIKCTDLPPSV